MLAPDNSIYHEKLLGKRALIFVPHEDDEINIAGNLIPLLRGMDVSVYVVFLTNGDYELPAETRMEEAAQSLDVLGVPREYIFFMGYPDSPNGSRFGHVYTQRGKALVTSDGRDETYGGAGFRDFAYTRFGEHSKYTHDSMVRDLRTLILDISPDLMVGTDLDIHSDHRACSFLLDEVLSDMFRQFPMKKRPLLWKRFAYSTAYNAQPDYYAENILETKCPDRRQPGGALIDCFCYEWSSRRRIPCALGNRVGAVDTIEKTQLFQAMRCHRSQRMELRADRILNSDEVFFARRTDSLSYEATVLASSGDASFLNGFQLYRMANLDSVQELPEELVWVPDDDDPEKAVTLLWKRCTPVKQICIYGGGRPIEQLVVSFDTGTKHVCGPLRTHGRATLLSLPETIYARSCCIKITKAPAGSGLAAIEVFASEKQVGGFPLFIKILVRDNFVYQYNRRISERRIPLEIYRLGTDDGICWEICSGNAQIRENILYLKDESDVIVKASLVSNPAVYDVVLISAHSALWFRYLVCLQFYRKLRHAGAALSWAISKRIMRYARVYKRNGISAVLAMMRFQARKKYEKAMKK